ncbi:MAG: hypothetical protein AUJ52_08725 [Elusimicrobia bacterium CG1_02_63_36]|nr:MAG: hypothetical protein AUJ52_08725 [Elusimicrobia bacterium CG1_02_63_36]PIP82589.1 MAG: hypothetical protein COR54_14030 [Elusimicrobia bacterium CG22_combo_CG10-13_8_21_14_all_63_91]PJA17227.1 MAG: hypothetical protein COX66_05230 [Elusimicrobia bacterium CG_4_10_14_0_2_um_filter_63_34]PJB25037.1 MAG: hypothetical protein CO113_10705 [Elusimicrobia bacterium CG_4_9_14_3_um_filter_62_55]
MNDEFDDWDEVDFTRVPGGGGKMTLYRREDRYSIWIDGVELMGCENHQSEDELARIVLADPALNANPHVLIGGLGMGFTLAAALRDLPENGRVTICELIPKVVEWNRGPLGHFAGRPLDDARVAVAQKDVGRLLQTQLEEYDAILLDVDNGPEGLVRGGNDWLYTEEGLDAAYSALRPGGLLAVWSTFKDPAFYMRLKKTGFKDVRQVPVRITFGADNNGHDQHMIWTCRRPRT